MDACDRRRWYAYRRGPVRQPIFVSLLLVSTSCVPYESSRGWPTSLSTTLSACLYVNALSLCPQLHRRNRMSRRGKSHSTEELAEQMKIIHLHSQQQADERLRKVRWLLAC